MSGDNGGATDRVAAEPEDLIRLILGDVVELDDLTAEPHRLSDEDVVFRCRSLMRRKSPERIRDGVREILTELELYRLGYDNGFEDGHLANERERGEQFKRAGEKYGDLGLLELAELVLERVRARIADEAER